MANVFTTVGAQFVTDLFDGTSSAPATHYIAWGTGAGTAVIGSTTLFTEGPETRVAATRSQPTAVQNQFVATITASAARTVTNAGVFSAATVGNLYLHSDFTGVVLATGDAIQFTFTLSWS
jgi:hypothetical protein